MVTRSSPVSLLWAAPDHASLLGAAVDVATADGLTYLGRLLSARSPGPGPDPARPPVGQPPLIYHLYRGAVDADYPASGGYVLHLYHFHEPWTHLGYAGARVSGARASAFIFDDALLLWSEGRPTEAVYELGRASHLLADSFIPYHAAGVAGCGHGPYEAWLTGNGRWREYLPGRGGRYQWQAVYRPGRPGAPHALDSRSPWSWVDLGAHESWVWFRDRLNGCARRPSGADVGQAFPAAAADLVPATVRYLAGYLNLFFSLAGVGT